MDEPHGTPIGVILSWLGAFLIVSGAVLIAARHVPWLYSWFGSLPGDLQYEGERTRVYAPIVSMALLSVVASLVLYVVQRLSR